MQITDGLKAGDKVVTDGLDRLRDGARITLPRRQARPRPPERPPPAAAIAQAALAPPAPGASGPRHRRCARR